MVLDYRNNMIKLKNILNKIIKESPDTAFSPDLKLLEWEDDDAIVFGYYKGKLYHGDATHSDLVVKNSSGKNIDRDEFTFPGRLWTYHNVISFWEYPPNKEEVLKILKILKKAYPREIDDINNYYVEVPAYFSNWNEFYKKTTYREMLSKLNKNNIDVVLVPISKYEKP